MNHGLTRLLLVVLCVLGLAGTAQAGTISLQITTRTMVRQGLLSLELSVLNRGDEAARNLQAEGLGPGQGVRSALVVLLPPGQKAGLRLSWPLPDRARGRHAVAVRVQYQDLNEYPFSALAWGYYWLGRDTASPLAVRAPAVQLAGSAEAALLLKNPLPRPLKVGVQVFAPQELSARAEPPALELPARGQGRVVVRLRNFSGLPGGRYQVLVLLGSRQEGLASVKAVPLMVSLVAEPGFWRRTRWWWALGALALLLAAGLGWWLARRRPRGRDAPGP